jgi:hypothetical protein
MRNNNQSSQPPPGKRKWGRIAGFLLALILLAWLIPREFEKPVAVPNNNGSSAV